MDLFSQYSRLVTLFESKHYKPVPVWGRIRKPGGEDFFFSQTIGTESTIPHCLLLERNSLAPFAEYPQLDVKLQEEDELSPTTDFSAVEAPDTIMLLALSSPGVCSHPATAHGGLISTILDEAMAHSLVSRFSTIPGKVEDVRRTLLTSQLEVVFRRPVRTPGVLIVKSWCVAGKGRKFWMRAQGTQVASLKEKLQDLDEEVKCEASGLWIKINPKL
ncbi:hypothetical protein BBK36DRAFT_1172489 [Trichoderma citrinoviride]|uniref:Thioesterase domain-containing protein n=1 Tax=Trichoderma citrinoviride TaxID=58853 RepID=A0A2T4B084_9HYPO|nr:hypothetical protein BBK36DRAFT_1172489 [Trichoderma citrinoviride]PTB62734.1 hypothetical protein BBK36DRAFT_1172489 [Trichoderma citrinoviride]